MMFTPMVIPVAARTEIPCVPVRPPVDAVEPVTLTVLPLELMATAPLEMNVSLTAIEEGLVMATTPGLVVVVEVVEVVLNDDVPMVTGPGALKKILPPLTNELFMVSEEPAELMRISFPAIPLSVILAPFKVRSPGE